MTTSLTCLAARLSHVPLANANHDRNPKRDSICKSVRAIPPGRAFPEYVFRCLAVLRSLIWSSTAIVAFALSGAPDWAHAQQSATKKGKELKLKSNEEKQLTAEETASVEDTIVRLTNIVRKRKGLGALKKSPALVFLARHHSRDMCLTGTFKHEAEEFPKGWQRFMERMKLAGLSDGGENIAFQTWTQDRRKWALSIVKGWVHSQPHLKNILDPEFRYVGVGIGQCGRNIGYVTQVFSTRQGKARDLQPGPTRPRGRTSSTSILTR
jgi:uncharacterized protein YkwD